MLEVIYNSNCPKSRAILEYLDEHNIKFQLIDLKTHQLSVLELKNLVKKLNIKPQYFLEKINKWKEKIGAKIEALTDDNIYEILRTTPDLIESPILIKGQVAMLGTPVDNIKFFVENS
ncbi:arsenate reductase family protein [Soonwooa sp.]|uniref:arsenate reductase family protein n=1 Tax=Soonwooa sp. TaxID=1938592 RepID=UPI0035AFAFEE